MKKKEEKWAIFWCDLLKPIIFSEIEAEGINQFLKMLAAKEVVFPDGRLKKPSLSTLRRKLKRYQNGGFNALERQERNDRGKPRKSAIEVIESAIEMKKEQPYRSHKTLNRLLQDKYGTTIARSTLFRHLKEAGATKIKLGVSSQKIRKRWTKDHTHDLWVGDFEEGPYVREGDEILPTYLSVFIDCHSRYAIEARYYLRQNLDILIDSLVRALAVHGAPRGLYLDNAKVYHSQGLKSACYRTNIRLIHRKAKDPAGGGLIERLIQTIQTQFESEVRAGDILNLNELNRALIAYLSVAYHEDNHSEIGCSPEEQYQTGLRVIRQVDMHEFIRSFRQRIQRTVNRTFSDVQLNKRYFKVDPKYRGDKVEVAFDPFSAVDTVEIYSLRDEYLCTGKLHNRETGENIAPAKVQHKPKHKYLDILVRKHNEELKTQTSGIDYRKVACQRTFPFHEFVKTIAVLFGKKGGLGAFSAHELEILKKTYNQSTKINKNLVKMAVEKASKKTIVHFVYQLKILISKKEV